MAITLTWSNDQELLENEAECIRMLEKLLDESAQAEQIEDGEVSLSFVDDETIRELNREYRGLDQPTDVLSFPMEDEQFAADLTFEADGDEEEMEKLPLLLGDIVISVPTAIRQSEQYGHSLDRELGFLFVHGFLHLIGYDHETKEEEEHMLARQEAVLLKAGLTR